ncbi:two-component system response regulator YesN [Paenibacillus anaericanus]|uniref:response regulator transcription factor n=1 Tax=Paenibacillus anaericanus TaxID=170367 RepID=UPI002789D588|nr:response regulator [Paenibacillus anaericanus]MDQ0088834.1 two-component system response regulator YesN [Paenibacillus anaericanus]
MINILVVDDQKHIRDGLQAMLRQFPLQLDNIYCAASGIEALQILREYSVQLVITDIRMPDMDGLTLMAQTKEELIKVDYLIISGYSDFSYAQKAIELGAKGYLLKPVKREDLQTAIEHVSQEIRTRQALSSNMENISRRAQETDRKELCMFMQGAANDEAWIRQTQQLNPELWQGYRLCLLREELRINQPAASSADGMESIAYRVFGRKGYICLQHRPYLILAVDATVATETLPSALKAAMIDAVTVMTSPQQGLKSLPGSYTEVLELYRHSYLFPDKRSIFRTHIEGLEQQWELPYEELYALFQLIGTKNSCQITEGISKMMHKNVLQRYNIRYTQQLCQAIVQLLEEYVRVILPYMGEETLDIECLRNLYDYPGIREYIQALQQQLLRLNQFYYDFKCSYRNTQDLNEAVRYIHENYHKPLDLAMVSNHVSLNYAYFSNLFKKNIGKGFAEYLRDVRLDKARRLLAETEYKIVEVTAMVGYESYKSFTRAFREVMDMQPTEYRQMMRRKFEREGKYHETAL